MFSAVSVYNSSNETHFYLNGHPITFTDKNNFYLPVSEIYGIFQMSFIPF